MKSCCVGGLKIDGATPPASNSSIRFADRVHIRWLWAEQLVLYSAERTLPLPVRRCEFSSRIISASSRCSAAAGGSTVVVALGRPPATAEFIQTMLRTAAFGGHLMQIAFWSCPSPAPFALRLLGKSQNGCPGMTSFGAAVVACGGVSRLNPFVLSTTQYWLLMLRALAGASRLRGCAGPGPSH